MAQRAGAYRFERFNTVHFSDAAAVQNVASESDRIREESGE
jgi:hypothetical protein